MTANSAAFDKNKAAGASLPNGNGQANGGPTASVPQPNQLTAPTGDPSNDDNAMMTNFAGELDFASMEAGDVLDQFNFDAFIDPGNDNLDSFNFDMGGFDGGMEAIADV